MYKLKEQLPKRAKKLYQYYYTRKLKECKDQEAAKQYAKDMVEKFLQAAAAAPTVFFCPNGAQEELINTFAWAIQSENNPTDIATIISTFANGVGKTTAMIHILMNLIFGIQNGWFDQGVFKKWTLPKNIWYCSTPVMLAEKIVPTILQLSETIRRMPLSIADREIDDDLLGDYEFTKPKEKKGSRWVESIDFNNGFRIHFWSYGQNPSELEGAEVGLIIDDEPAPEAFNKAQKSRRRLGNITCHIMTPLFCDPYLVDEYKSAKEGDIEGVTALEASVYEACEERGVRGHLKRSTIDRMMDEYDSDEKEARGYGRFMFYSTNIYKFTPDIHIVKPIDVCKGFIYHGKQVLVPDNAILKMANDPKDGTADAVVYGYVFPGGRKFIFAETPVEHQELYWKMKKRQSIREKILEWIELEVALGIRMDRRIMDMIFAFQQTRGGQKLVDIYEETAAKLLRELGKKDMKFLFYESHGRSDDMKMLKYRHSMVAQDLEIQPDGMPNLLISENCVHTIRGLEHYIRQHKTSQLENIMEVDAPPVPKFKDFPDAVGFFVCDDSAYKIQPDVKKTYATGGSNWVNNV
jgi:hypothetical protein